MVGSKTQTFKKYKEWLLTKMLDMFLTITAKLNFCGIVFFFFYCNYGDFENTKQLDI